jgi:SsrA-binding protein
MKSAMREQGIKVISKNRRASHEYHLGTRYEAGMVLTGTEIKSIRNHKVDLKRGFARLVRGEVWLFDMHISPYEQGNRENHEPERPRKLLLRRKEIAQIERATQEKGTTMIPTRLYLKDGYAKVEIAIARGKKLYDKRQDIAKRDSQRQVERALREKYRG